MRFIWNSLFILAKRELSLTSPIPKMFFGSVFCLNCLALKKISYCFVKEKFSMFRYCTFFLVFDAETTSFQTTQHHLQDCWVAKSRDAGDVWWERVGALLPLTSISDCLFFTRTTVRGCLQSLMPLWFGDYPASPFNVLLSLDLSSILTFSLHLWQSLLSYLRDLQQWQFFI